MLKPITLAFTIPLVLLVMAQTCEGQRVRLEARMGSNDRAQSKARFEQRGGRMKFNLELEDAAPGVTFQVTVHRRNKTIYSRSIQTNKFGFAEIDIDNTEGDSVPGMNEGDVVTVRAKNGDQMQGILQQR